MAESKFDVVIVGAGLAGGCLARQLRLRMPELSVAVIDKKTEFDYWVGESTIEMWEYYAAKVLNLGPYLEKHHYLKNGLRFFFDTPEKDLSMKQMSEVGRKWYFALNSHQIDRATIDRDLCAMNREMGVDVRLGVTVQSLTIDAKDGHLLKTTDGDIRCTYIVDASGRSSILERHGYVKVDKDDPKHPCASYWARYENVNVIDELGDDEWRRRVGYGHRWLSTTHFMYPGYWVWHIPVTDKILSLGVAFNRDMYPDWKFRNVGELTEWMKTHQWGREILGDKYKELDFFGLKQLTRCADKTFSADRWFMTGMSGHFIDPLYSGTCASIATANLLIEEAIRFDRQEKDDVQFARMCDHISMIFHLLHEDTVRDLDGHRHVGSIDTFITHYWPLLHEYYNARVPMLMDEFKWPLEVLKAHIKDPCECSLERLRAAFANSGTIPAIYAWNEQFFAYLKASGRFYERNKDVYFENYTPYAFVKKMLDNDFEKSAVQSKQILRWVHEYTMRRMAEVEGFAVDQATLDRQYESAYEQLMGEPSKVVALADMLAELKAASPGPAQPMTSPDEVTKYNIASLEKHWPR